MNPEYVVVLTTLPADADGAAFGRTLVEERLAACVNLLRQVIVKTSRDRVVALWDRIREIHPYEVPEFVVLPIVDGSDAYLRWLGESTSQT